MIDMVFLLLVFFMTVSTLAQEERIPLELPESEQADVPDDRTDRGTISLQYSDNNTVEIFVGSSPLSLKEMQAVIKASILENPDLKINLRTTPDMPFKEIKRVLIACAEVGAHDIVYATYQAL